MTVELEQQAIESAFENSIARAYDVLQAAYIAAEGDVQLQGKAAEKFRHLVMVARKVRAMAMAQLQP